MCTHLNKSVKVSYYNIHHNTDVDCFSYASGNSSICVLLVPWSSNYARTRNEIDQMFVRCRCTSFAKDCGGFVGVQTGIELGSDHAMVRARQRLRIKAAHLSNRPARGDTAELKTKALENTE